MGFDEASFQKYNNRFNDKLDLIKAGPVEERQCNDKGCFGCFGLFFGGFIGITIYFIASGAQYLSELGSALASTDNSDLGATLGKTVPQVVGMIMLSIGLSIIFVVLASKFPKCVAYTCIIGTLLVYVALIIIGIVTNLIGLAVVFAIVLLINLCILWCYWQWIQIGIVILKVSGDFITQKPSVYFISLISLVLSLLFEILWIIGYLAGYSQTLETNNADENSRNTYGYVLIAYYVIGIFFGFFLYYCMVFVVAMATAHWYYKIQDKNVLSGFSTVKTHLGSITFASIVITILTVLRMAARDAANDAGGAFAIVMCIIACLLSCIEELIKVLNHNAVIVMAVTGEDYIDSAKSAISIIFENFGLFVIVDFFVDFIGIYSVIICVLVPSLIGGFLINAIQNDPSAAVVGGILIFILAWITSSVILGMLEEVISCVFIFYCFDSKFQKQGLNVSNIPQDIKNIFDDAGNGRQYKFGEHNNNNKHKKRHHQQSEMQLHAQRNNQHQGGRNPQQGQGGYNPQQQGWGGQQQGGYNQGGYNQGGYNQGGYNQGGY